MVFLGLQKFRPLNALICAPAEAIGQRGKGGKASSRLKTWVYDSAG
jgi:hypothetical protein